MDCCDGGLCDVPMAPTDEGRKETAISLYPPQPAITGREIVWLKADYEGMIDPFHGVPEVPSEIFLPRFIICSVATTSEFCDQPTTEVVAKAALVDEVRLGLSDIERRAAKADLGIHVALSTAASLVTDLIIRNRWR